MSFERALGWSYVMYGGQYAITSVITLVLAAVLGPSVFGLVAMALVYLMFMQMLVRQGMIPALIQRSELNDAHKDSAFWLTVTTGVALTALTLLLSDWWADINRTPDLKAVIDVMSVVIPLHSLVVVQEALLSRRMDFRGLAMRTNAAALVGGVVGLGLALVGFGIWALVALHIVKAVVDVIVLWSLSDWRPHMAFSWDAARELFGFSGVTTIAGFGEFVNSKADALLIGLFFGPTAVGLYRIAVRVVDLVVDVTVRAFHSVSLPELSRLKDDPRRFTDRITNVVHWIGLIVLPGLAIVAGSSEALMDVLGREWGDAAAPLAVLCIVGATTALTLVVGPIVLAVGRPFVLAVIQWASAIFSAASFVVAGILFLETPIAGQVLGVAVVRVALFSSAAIAFTVWVIGRFSNLSLRALGHALMPAIWAAGLGYVAARLIASLSWTSNEFVVLVSAILASALVTAVLLVGIDPTVRQLMGKVIQSIKR